MQSSMEFSRPAFVAMQHEQNSVQRFPKDDKLEAWRAEQFRKNVTRVVRRIPKEQ